MTKIRIYVGKIIALPFEGFGLGYRVYFEVRIEGPGIDAIKFKVPT